MHQTDSTMFRSGLLAPLSSAILVAAVLGHAGCAVKLNGKTLGSGDSSAPRVHPQPAADPATDEPVAVTDGTTESRAAPGASQPAAPADPHAAVRARAVMTRLGAAFTAHHASDPDRVEEAARQLGPDDLVHTTVELGRDRFAPIELGAAYSKGSAWACRGLDALAPEYPTVCATWDAAAYYIKFELARDDAKLPAKTTGILWSAPGDPASRDWAYLVTLDGGRYRVAVHELAPGPGDAPSTSLVHRGLFFDDFRAYDTHLGRDYDARMDAVTKALVACKDRLWERKYAQQVKKLKHANLLPTTRRNRIASVRNKHVAETRKTCASKADAKRKTFLEINRAHDERRRALAASLVEHFGLE